MKAYFIRSAEGGEEKGPFDVGEIMIFYRGGDLSPTTEVRFESAQTWTPVPEFLEKWEKGVQRRDLKQVFGGLALVVGGIGLGALTGMATGISFLFMGVVFAGGAMFFRGMRGGSF
jgi:hypothetical protein